MTTAPRTEPAIVRIGGKRFYCTVAGCGVGVFAHDLDRDTYTCNGCGAEYAPDGEETVAVAPTSTQQLQYPSDRLLWNDHTVPVAEKMPRDKTPGQTTIWDYQTQIWPWAAHNFGDERVLEPIIAAVGLSEEVGELHRALLKDHQGIRGTHEEWVEEQKKELGDVFIKVVEVGARLGFDMEQVLYDRWQSIKKRDWRADAIGHGIDKEQSA